MQSLMQPEEMEMILSSTLDTCVDLAIETHTKPFVSRKQSRSVLGKLIDDCNIDNQKDASMLTMPHAHYSLSHCLNTVVAVANRLTDAMGIGVDLEYGRSVNPMSAKFFLTKKEQVITTEDDSTSGHLLRIWTVKEAVFKADLENHSNFWFFDYETQDPQAWTGIATKLNNHNRQKKFRYTSIPYRDGFLTVALAI